MKEPNWGVLFGTGEEGGLCGGQDIGRMGWCCITERGAIRGELEVDLDMKVVRWLFREEGLILLDKLISVLLVYVPISKRMQLGAERFVCDFLRKGCSTRVMTRPTVVLDPRSGRFATATTRAAMCRVNAVFRGW